MSAVQSDGAAVHVAGGQPSGDAAEDHAAPAPPTPDAPALSSEQPARRGRGNRSRGRAPTSSRPRAVTAPAPSAPGRPQRTRRQPAEGRDYYDPVVVEQRAAEGRARNQAYRQARAAQNAARKERSRLRGASAAPNLGPSGSASSTAVPATSSSEQAVTFAAQVDTARPGGAGLLNQPFGQLSQFPAARLSHEPLSSELPAARDPGPGLPSSALGPADGDVPMLDAAPVDSTAPQPGPQSVFSSVPPTFVAPTAITAASSVAVPSFPSLPARPADRTEARSRAAAAAEARVAALQQAHSAGANAPNPVSALPVHLSFPAGPPATTSAASGPAARPPTAGRLNHPPGDISTQPTRAGPQSPAPSSRRAALSETTHAIDVVAVTVNDGPTRAQDSQRTRPDTTPASPARATTGTAGEAMDVVTDTATTSADWVSSERQNSSASRVHEAAASRVPAGRPDSTLRGTVAFASDAMHVVSDPSAAQIGAVAHAASTEAARGPTHAPGEALRAVRAVTDPSAGDASADVIKRILIFVTVAGAIPAEFVQTEMFIASYRSEGVPSLYRLLKKGLALPDEWAAARQLLQRALSRCPSAAVYSSDTLPVSSAPAGVTPAQTPPGQSVMHGTLCFLVDSAPPLRPTPQQLGSAATGNATDVYAAHLFITHTMLRNTSLRTPSPEVRALSPDDPEVVSAIVPAPPVDQASHEGSNAAYAAIRLKYPGAVEDIAYCSGLNHPARRGLHDDGEDAAFDHDFRYATAFASWRSLAHSRRISDELSLDFDHPTVARTVSLNGRHYSISPLDVALALGLRHGTWRNWRTRFRDLEGARAAVWAALRNAENVMTAQRRAQLEDLHHRLSFFVSDVVAVDPRKDPDTYRHENAITSWKTAEFVAAVKPWQPPPASREGGGAPRAPYGTDVQHLELLVNITGSFADGKSSRGHESRLQIERTGRWVQKASSSRVQLMREQHSAVSGEFGMMVRETDEITRAGRMSASACEAQQQDGDDLLLFNEVLFSFIMTPHAATDVLRSYIDVFTGKSRAQRPLTSLSEHPLWSEEDNGIVLHDAVRSDARRRTFFTRRQIDAMLAAAVQAVAGAERLGSSEAGEDKLAPEDSMGTSQGGRHEGGAGDDRASGGATKGSAEATHDGDQATGPGGGQAETQSDKWAFPPGTPPFFSDKVKPYALQGPAEPYLQTEPVPHICGTSAALAALRRDNQSLLRVPGFEPPGSAPAHQPVDTCAPKEKEASSATEERFDEDQATFEDARAAYRTAQESTYVSVDIEVARKDANRITEVGVAFSSDLNGPASAEHFVIRENEQWRDRAHYRWPPSPTPPTGFPPFIFGSTAHVRLEEALSAVHYRVAAAMRRGPVYLCFHDQRMEKEYLCDAYWVLPKATTDTEAAAGPGTVVWLDTQVLFSGKTRTRSTLNNRVSLLDMLSQLGIEADPHDWHNAGNDAKTGRRDNLFNTAAMCHTWWCTAGKYQTTSPGRYSRWLSTPASVHGVWQWCAAIYARWLSRHTGYGRRLRSGIWSRYPHAAPACTAEALRAYVVAGLGRKPGCEALLAAAALLRDVEDYLGWDARWRAYGKTNAGRAYFDMPYSAAVLSVTLSSLADGALTRLGSEGAQAMTERGAGVVEVLAEAVRGMHRRPRSRETNSPVARRVPGVVDAMKWITVGECPRMRTWFMCWEADPEPANLNWTTLERAIETCLGSVQLHWACLPFVFQVAAEHIVRGNPLYNEVAGLTVEEMRSQLLVHFLSILRVVLYTENDLASVRPLVEAVLVLLPPAGDIALHKNRELHQPVRRAACAALLHPDICPVREGEARDADVMVTSAFGEYLLALVAAQPCSNSTTAPAWADNYEAALGLAYAVAAAPYAICSHIRKELDGVYANAREKCGRSLSSDKTQSFCVGTPGMSYMSAVWRMRGGLGNRPSSVEDHGMRAYRVGRANNPVWVALLQDRFRHLAERNGPQMDVRAHLLGVMTSAKKVMRESEEYCFFPTCEAEHVGTSQWECCDLERYPDRTSGAMSQHLGGGGTCGSRQSTTGGVWVPPLLVPPLLRIPDELMRDIIALAVAGGAVPWQIAQVCKLLRQMTFSTASFWSLDTIVAYLGDIEKYFTRNRYRAPSATVANALRAYVLVSLGDAPTQEKLMAVANVLRRIEDGLGGGSDVRPYGAPDSAIYRLPYSASAMSRTLARFVEEALKGCTAAELKVRGNTLLKVAAEAVRMLHRTGSPPAEKALRVVEEWWLAGACAATRAWILGFEMAEGREFLSFEGLELMQTAAEHILRAGSTTNTDRTLDEIPEHGDELKAHLSIHMLCLLRVMAFADVDVDALRSSSPNWGLNFEATLGISYAAVTAPYAICKHVRDVLDDIIQNARNRTHGTMPQTVTQGFLHGSPGMSYRSPLWTFKTDAHRPGAQDNGVYGTYLWSEKNPVWRYLVSQTGAPASGIWTIANEAGQQESRFDALSQPAAKVRCRRGRDSRLSHLRDAMDMASEAERRGEQGCYFVTCGSERLGEGVCCRYVEEYDYLACRGAEFGGRNDLPWQLNSQYRPVEREMLAINGTNQRRGRRYIVAGFAKNRDELGGLVEEPSMPTLQQTRTGQVPDDILRMILCALARDKEVFPWRVGQIGRGIRDMTFNAPSLDAGESARVLVPRKKLGPALRSYVLAALGDAPDLKDLLGAGKVLAMIEDDYGAADGRHSYGQSERLVSVVRQGCVNSQEEGAMQELDAHSLGKVACQAARMLQRTQAPVSAAVVGLVGGMWEYGLCAVAKAWIATFEACPTARLLNGGRVTEGLRTLLGRKEMHWGCMADVTATVAEHILMGDSRVNEEIAELLTVVADRLLNGELQHGGSQQREETGQMTIHLLSLLRVLLYAECGLASVRTFAVAVVRLLPPADEIARHRHRDLHQPIRRAACAGILHAGMWAASPGGNLGRTFAGYLLALAHGQPCSREPSTQWADSYEAALALGYAALAVPEALCVHVQEDVYASWVHAQCQCQGRLEDERARRFCLEVPGMSYASRLWRLKTPAYEYWSRRLRDGHGADSVHLWRQTRPEWVALTGMVAAEETFR
ncbi:hypothetical protein AURDEDRAFT_127890 [Auricularia subglabra TFB-10046 SS5]|nr:hypothetical protein AURDEDRAFT_127890 [Auricularia subglabra TFB-10046 SS5]